MYIEFGEGQAQKLVHPLTSLQLRKSGGSYYRFRLSGCPIRFSVQGGVRAV